jgi:hypothetical protein
VTALDMRVDELAGQAEKDCGQARGDVTSLANPGISSKTLLTKNSLIDIATGKEIHQFARRQPWLVTMACAPDGKILTPLLAFLLLARYETEIGR